MSRRPIGSRDLARLAVTVQREIAAKRASASATDLGHPTARARAVENAAPAGGTGYGHGSGWGGVMTDKETDHRG